MKIEVWVSTNKVGSECRASFEVDDEDLEGMSESERDDYIDEIARETMFEMIEWNWRAKE